MEKSKRHNKCRNDLVAGATQVSSRKRDNLTVAGVADRMARKSKRHNKMENEESTYINDIAYMGNRCQNCDRSGGTEDGEIKTPQQMSE